jgi:hypothetical protein
MFNRWFGNKEKEKEMVNVEDFRAILASIGQDLDKILDEATECVNSKRAFAASKSVQATDIRAAAETDFQKALQEAVTKRDQALQPIPALEDTASQAATEANELEAHLRSLIASGKKIS